jgi:hypothetical protein
MREIEGIENYKPSEDLYKKVKADNFKRCCFIFGLQIILVILLAFYFLENKSFNLGDFQTQISRYICAILLHIQLLGEV